MGQKEQNTSQPPVSRLPVPSQLVAVPALRPVILTFRSTTISCVSPFRICLQSFCANSYSPLSRSIGPLADVVRIGLRNLKDILAELMGIIRPSSAPQDSVSYWEGDSASGKPSIKIKLSEQRAYFYKGGQLVGMSQLSTGREGLTTPSGSFSITQKDKDHVSTKYGDYVDEGDNVVVPNVEIGKDPKPPGTHFKGAPMPYFMRIVGGVGMHAGYLARLPGLSRVHSNAGIHGGKLLSIGLPRHASND